MSHHFLDVVLLSKSLFAIFLKELCNEVLCRITYINTVLLGVWPSERCLLDELVHLVLILVIKWWDADYHFVNQYSKRPPIKRVVMTCAYNHLWRQVLRSTTERVWLSCIRRLLVDLCKTEVSQ